MSVYSSPNCGQNRSYVFRPLKTKKFRFRVKALSNANVCLTGAAAETPNFMFELFLGGWNGGESAIRKNKGQDVCRVKTPGVLSASQFRGFWVHVAPNAIQVGKEGESNAFMTHHENNIGPRIKFYGFCTAHGATGSWTFGDDDPCSFGTGQGFGGGNQSTGNSNIGFFPHQQGGGGCVQPPQGGGYVPPAQGGGFVPPPQGGGYVYIPPAQGGGYVPPSQGDFLSGNTNCLKWVMCYNGSRCPSPFPVAPQRSPFGRHRFSQNFVAIAHHNRDLVPGTFFADSNSCQVSFAGGVQIKQSYWLLSNPAGAELVWQSASGGAVPMGAVQGGYTETGEKLYVGRYHVNNTWVSGKVHPSHRVCYVPLNGAEQSQASYEVLCLKTVPLANLGLQ